MKVRRMRKRNGMMQGSFSAVYEKREKFWIAWVEELPGANTQGRTLKEARENLKEAIKLVIETNRELFSPESDGDHIRREAIRVSV
jgi:predicted RNase H-like HicB family nuclease